MESKVCLITGASSGIGVGIAHSLVKIGVKKLVLVARRRDKLENVAKECRDAGAEDVLVLDKDLSVLPNCAKAIKETIDHFGRLDVLINNAAITDNCLMADGTIEKFQEITNMNLISPYALTKEAIPFLRKEKGNVVFVSSILGADLTIPENGMYSASKAALNKIAKSFALEEAKNEVRFNIVSPGAVLTDMLRGFFEKSSGQAMNDEVLEAILSTQCQALRRVGRPDHIGEAVAYLANETVSAYTTGTNLVVDGGACLAWGPDKDQSVNN